MNQSFRLFRCLGALALLTAVIGCATTGPQTPDLLVAAGFKPVSADTTEKQDLLKSLPTGKVSQITWKGKSFYVQPDVPNNRAYVGRLAEFQTYEQLRLAKQLSNDNLTAAQMNRDAMARWDLWGPGMSGLYGRRY